MGGTNLIATFAQGNRNWLHRLLALMVLLMAGGLAPSALAETRVALVIANSDYRAAPLSNPQVDLGLVVPALEAMGFDVTSVLNADLASFDSALNAFNAKARGADLALFYFAGHGFALNNGIQVQSYLMSTSADVTSSSDRVIISGGIPLDVIANDLTNAAKTTLIFIDACRNDPRVRAVGNSGRGFAPVGDYVGGDIFIGLSTRIGDTAADGTPGEGSPFAQAFVEHMSEPGLSVDRAFNKVRLEVQQKTGSQRPEAERADLRDPDHVILMASAGNTKSLTVETTGSGSGSNQQAAAVVPKEEEARLTWDSIKDSSSIAIMRRFAEAFDGTIYASFASARADELAAGGSGRNSASGNDEDRSRPTQLANLPGNVGTQITGGRTEQQASLPLADPCDKEAVASSVLGAGQTDDTYISARDAIAACLLTVARKPNDHQAEYQLAHAYDVASDLASAMPWYDKAAKGGVVEAMTPMGYIYERGEVVPQDYSRARYWYEQAAKHDVGFAMQNLGFMYEYGNGVPKDQNKARGLLTRAANKGEVNAALMLAYDNFHGDGVPVNYNEAHKWYARAADANAPDGLYMMGYMYRDGLGVSANAVTARDWFRLASSAKNTLAMHSLALLLDSGTGGPRDPAEAARLMIDAIELGETFTYDQLTTNSTAFSEDMRKDMQRVMQQKGVYSGALDGQFGRGTIAAIDALMPGGKGK